MSLLILSIYDFTEDDLSSNRRGFITPGQQKWLDGLAGGMRNLQNGALKWAVFFLFFGFCMISGLMLSSESYRKMILNDPLSFAPYLCIIPFILGIFLASNFFSNRRARQVSESELKMAEGIIRLDEEHSSVGTAYFVFVGETKFGFPEPVGDRFIENKKFRVYYAESRSARLVLSYEAVG